MLDFVFNRLEFIWYFGICKCSKIYLGRLQQTFAQATMCGRTNTNNYNHRSLCPHICNLTLLLSVLEALVQVAAVYIQTLMKCKLKGWQSKSLMQMRCWTSARSLTCLKPLL